MWYSNFKKFASESMSQEEFGFSKQIPSKQLKADLESVNRACTVIAVMLLKENINLTQIEGISKSLRELKEIKDQGRWPLDMTVGQLIVQKFEIVLNHPLYGDKTMSQEQKQGLRRVGLDRLRDLMNKIIQ